MKSKLWALAGALLLSTGAHAQTAPGQVPFQGTVTNLCAFLPGTGGTLKLTDNATVLTSRTSQSDAGSISALVTGGQFKVTTVAPDAFVPALTPATFRAWHTVGGDTKDGASPHTLPVGTTPITVDLEATATGGVFRAGAYVATVTVRCEAT